MNPKQSRARRLCLAVAAAAATITALIAVPASGAGDRNDDGIPDRWERKHHLSLKHNQAKRDQDKDELKNKGEWKAHMDPRDDDSDDDGVEDGDEGAGTIDSFDATSGELVINVFNGSKVSGLVTDATEIKCEGPDDDNSSDDSGEDPDADHGDDGPGEEADDDHGSDDGNDDRLRSDDGERDDDSDVSCGVEALVPGTTVEEAELEVTADGPVFEEVELR